MTVFLNRDDFGFNIDVTLFDLAPPAVLNVSTADLVEILFYPPRKPVRVRTMTLISGGADGRVRRAVIQGDCTDRSGVWRARVRVTWPGVVRTSDDIFFTVR